MEGASLRAMQGKTGGCRCEAIDPQLTTARHVLLLTWRNGLKSAHHSPTFSTSCYYFEIFWYIFAVTLVQYALRPFGFITHKPCLFSSNVVFY